MKSIIHLMIGALGLMLFPLSASAELVPLTKIAQMIEAHQYHDAEIALKAGLQDHPNSALGWYYLAQTEHFEHHDLSAEAALDQAKHLDPTLRFALSPEQVSALHSAIEQDLGKANSSFTPGTTTLIPTSSGYHSHDSSLSFFNLFIGFIVFVGVLLLIVWVIRLFTANSGGTTYVPNSGYGGIGSSTVGNPGGTTIINNNPSGMGGGGFVSGTVAGALADELLNPRQSYPTIIEENGPNYPGGPVVQPPIGEDVSFDPGSSSDPSWGGESGSASDSGGSSGDSSSSDGWS